MNTALPFKTVNRIISCTALSAAVCLVLGCATTKGIAPGVVTAAIPVEFSRVPRRPLMPPVIHFENMARTAGEGESEIVVCMFMGRTEIFIDGQKRMLLKFGESGTVVVPDGRHTVTTSRYLIDKQPFTLDIAGSRVVIEVNTMSAGHNIIGLSKYAEIPLEAYKSIGIEEATKRASLYMVSGLLDGSKIAVVYVAAEGAGIASLVMNEVEFHLVSAERFTIVDRNTLDLILNEQKFQTSGAVNDADVVQIGKLSGANVVITGSVIKSGDSSKLSLKALDVRTGQIVTMALESY